MRYSHLCQYLQYLHFDCCILLNSSLLHLVLAAAFRMLPGFVLDILGLHFDCRVLLDVLLLNIHMLVVALLQLPLHTLVEGWLHTLLVAVPRELQEVARTLGWMVHTQLVAVPGMLVL